MYCYRFVSEVSWWFRWFYRFYQTKQLKLNCVDEKKKKKKKKKGEMLFVQQSDALLSNQEPDVS